MTKDNDLIGRNYTKEESDKFRSELFDLILNDGCLNIGPFILTGEEKYHFRPGAYGSKESLYKITKEYYYKLLSFLKKYQYLKKCTELNILDNKDLINDLDYQMLQTIVKDAEYCNRVQDIVNACLHQGLLYRYSNEAIKYVKLKTSLLPLVLADTTYDIEKVKMAKENSYMFLCPIHVEHTPSFRVYDSTNSYTCYGCGYCGDIINYVKKVRNVSFLDAIDLLLKIFLLKETKEQDPLYEVIKKYQDSITSDEYQYLLQLGIERMYKYGNLFMPDRTELVDEYYNQKFQLIERIKNHKFDPILMSYKAPDYIILNFEEPVEQVQKRKTLIQKRRSGDLSNMALGDDLPF